MRSAPPSPALSSTELPSYDEAAALVAAYAARLSACRYPAGTVALDRASGRILAQALHADRDQPPFTRSTRDGYACRAAEASTHAPLIVAGATRAGQAPSGPLPAAAAWEIMTGAPVPAGADAVVMLEHVEALATATGKSIRLRPPRTVKAGENVVAQAAQAHAGEQLLPPGVLLGFAQIALAASVGCTALQVVRRPRVAILATGDELIPAAASPSPGQIRNSNGPMLAEMAVGTGADPWLLPTASDDARTLDAALALAAEADLLLISGGVSAGKFDLVEPALARAGARFYFTGVSIQPGKPLVFGELPRASVPALPFFGLPGNPVSSAVTFLLFAAPVLAALAQSREQRPRFALARLAARAERGGKPGLTRFLPVFCTFSASVAQMPEVAFVPWHGSGDLAALARSNCFLVVPEDAPDLEPGAIARILLP